jgi:hypothetical protein
MFGSPLRPSAAAKAQAVSASYLGDLRRKGILINGIHYRVLAQGIYRYHDKAIDHFFRHRQDPEEHQRWIEQQALKQG